MITETKKALTIYMLKKVTLEELEYLKEEFKIYSINKDNRVKENSIIVLELIDLEFKNRDEKLT